MNRRHALIYSSAGVLFSSAVAPASAALQLIPLLKILGGLTVKRSAPAAIGIGASRIVTRTIVRGGVVKTVQTVSTAQLGISVAGISALSLGAAELIEKFGCKSIYVRGESDAATVVSQALTRPTHVTINVYNAETGKLEDYGREYVNPGNSEFRFKIPNGVDVGVKRLDGRADDDPTIPPFTSGNVLLAGRDDVFAG